MSPSITYAGIEDVISNLNYKNKRTLKYKFIEAVQDYYHSEEDIDSLESIDPDELIKKIWNIDDPEKIRLKRINLTSIKSTVNTDLNKLFKSGKNPEGLNVGRLMFLQCWTL